MINSVSNKNEWKRVCKTVNDKEGSDANVWVFYWPNEIQEADDELNCKKVLSIFWRCWFINNWKLLSNFLFGMKWVHLEMLCFAIDWCGVKFRNANLWAGIARAVCWWLLHDETLIILRLNVAWFRSYFYTVFVCFWSLINAFYWFFRYNVGLNIHFLQFKYFYLFRN